MHSTHSNSYIAKLLCFITHYYVQKHADFYTALIGSIQLQSTLTTQQTQHNHAKEYTMRTTFTAHVQHLLFQQEFNSELYTITELEDLGKGNYVCDMARKFCDGSIGYIVLNIINEKFVVDFSISLPDCTITYIVDTKRMYGSIDLFTKAIQAIIPLWDSMHYNYKNIIEHMVK